MTGANVLHSVIKALDIWPWARH